MVSGALRYAQLRHLGLVIREGSTPFLPSEGDALSLGWASEVASREGRLHLVGSWRASGEGVATRLNPLRATYRPGIAD